MKNITTIPRPLVRLNQMFIAISSFMYIISGYNFILLFPILACLSSLFLSFNPIMALGKRFLKKPLNEYIQDDKAQQRFNQILAFSMLVLSYSFSLLKLNILSVVFASMVFIASTVALLGFCIGCYIHYQYHMWKYRRSLIKI
jgi:hypothetical protein